MVFEVTFEVPGSSECYLFLETSLKLGTVAVPESLIIIIVNTTGFQKMAFEVTFEVPVSSECYSSIPLKLATILICRNYTFICSCS